MGGWLLEVPEFDGADHWRWRLTDPDGAEVAVHQVALDPGAPEYEGFVDLAGHLRRRADPDRRAGSEAELVERVGAWAGAWVLGPLAEPLADAAPAVVRVELPAGAEALLDRPLELAHARGRPLALQDLSLVFAPAGPAAGASKAPVEGRLRLLAVFSLPVETAALAVRRERYELARLVRRVATRHRRAIQLEVVQYGATRERLAEVLEQGDGWDVAHFSGHGLAGGLLLEHADGTPDLVTTEELARLLRPTRRRLKLVTLSSSRSAAASVVDARRWLGLPVPGELEADADTDATPAPGEAAGRRSPLPALAAELADGLGCTVLAMRYPVVDDFGVALTERLYEQLVGSASSRSRWPFSGPCRRWPAPARPAAPRPCRSPPRPCSAPWPPSCRWPPRPGPRPASTCARRRCPGSRPSRSGSWAEPAPMARASAALAPANPHVGVLFHGMAGAGKTACALELAYRHERAFEALAFWKAPELADPDSIAPALVNLAMALEVQLPGLEMVQAVADRAQLAQFLPRLTELLDQRAVLLVLDNLESLLTDQGTWRDPRWADLMAALTGHRGESRVVLTSRVRPSGLDERVQVQPVHALSLNESLLLARELPNLGRLVREDPATQDRGEDAPSGWSLVRQTLALVQGHPTLLQLADAVAADPAALAAQLAAADQATEAADRNRLAAFFDQGETELAAGHFVRALGDWTRQATTALPGGAAVLSGWCAAWRTPTASSRSSTRSGQASGRSWVRPARRRRWRWPWRRWWSGGWSPSRPTRPATGSTREWPRPAAPRPAGRSSRSSTRCWPGSGRRSSSRPWRRK